MSLQTLMWIATIASFIQWVWNTLEMWIGHLFVPVLRKTKPLPDSACPKLSIVIAARNEDEHIGNALISVLQMDYPRLEVIAVNDRSTDRTGEIMHQLQTRFSSLRIETIHELPKGWLGKTHAMQKGAEASTGDWILFTDADVHFGKDALRRIMNIALSRNADHIPALPRMMPDTFLADTFVSYFTVMLNFGLRIWQAPVKWLPGHIGIGAFNLVRKSAYEAIGMHEKLKLQVVDDVLLGRLMKRHGFRQIVVNACPNIDVKWMTHLSDASRLLDKNAFAGFDYSWSKLIFICAFLVLTTLWPIAGLFAPFPIIRCLCALALLGMICASMFRAFYTFAGFVGYMKYALQGLLWPCFTFAFVYVNIRSAIKTTSQGGVSWRDSFYSLRDLKVARKSF